MQRKSIGQQIFSFITTIGMILLTCFLLINAAYGEEMKKDGVHTEYVPNSKQKYEVTYKDGKKNGPTKIYSEDGALLEEMNYKDDKEDGSSITYSENGIPTEETIFKNGQLVMRKDYYENGKLKAEENIKSMTRDGITKIYYPSGKLWVTDTYKGGKLLDEKGNLKNGNKQKYYENGKLASETLWRDGVLQAPRKIYYEDGKIQEDWSYVDDNFVIRKFDKHGESQSVTTLPKSAVKQTTSSSLNEEPY